MAGTVTSIFTCNPQSNRVKQVVWSLFDKWRNWDKRFPGIYSWSHSKWVANLGDNPRLSGLLRKKLGTSQTDLMFGIRNLAPFTITVFCVICLYQWQGTSLDSCCSSYAKLQQLLPGLPTPALHSDLLLHGAGRLILLKPNSIYITPLLAP